jgi:hydroxymethylpyrimidine kinase/phosphomethylpyrimidine kinase/thiamine-phosphate diphosphorylase
MALDYFIEDALVIAKAYLNQGLKASKALGAGEGAIAHCGWPTDRADFPEVVLPESSVGYELDLPGRLEAGPGFEPCDTNRLGLYPVVDSVEWVARLLKFGVKTLQLRIKDKQPKQVEQQIIDAIALGKEYNARLFINDYWQLAIKHNAYGVHLGQEDMDVADLPLIAEAGLRLGLSTHGYYEMLRARQLKPSYIALGHIFPTQTKDMPSDPQGLTRLSQYAHLMSDIATVAIGGINLDRAPAVWDTGVGSIAVVTAITLADDPQQVINQFNDIMC